MMLKESGGFRVTMVFRNEVGDDKRGVKEDGVEAVINEGWTDAVNQNVTDRIASCASALDRWNRGSSYQCRNV